MRTALRTTSIFIVLLFLVALSGKPAGAVPVVLQDNPDEYFTALSTNAGASYRVSISYWIETGFQEATGASSSHDTFYYAFLSSATDLSTSEDLFNSGNLLFDNGELVDIFGEVLPSAPNTFVTTVTADQFLFPYFFVDTGNNDFTSTVHVDYEIARVETAPVPEPSTVILLGAGMVGLIGFSRRRK